ncbi:hypothetical protein P153DRAFT_285407 [Dothidotthia symphoricarpi CBS 119687]|uniref:F-box domain-containing protein n=1 Tax=Dothidotthia symphoricarpi CBS 119687 TaxID=1392245 RepID=A0A6A6AKZ1_9PLEO|nr:uncharacterized protein P153DRAFT_285407 [Dothidotthia symphoricarpi CBS 119687]KAF2131863.1 hypothetical protein P153DRAFT_285407 [Dothidotthia symphoricarpi CBS 119687]
MPTFPTKHPPGCDFATTAVDPGDPEGFLRRCSGHNKKTKLRCNAVIGKKSQSSCRPKFLPTCHTHRDQQSLTGWCQFRHPDGERCPVLFRWVPPYFELCAEHQGHPDMPCYFLKLPLELRHEIFRYLLPSDSIGSSSAGVHHAKEDATRNGSLAIPSGPASSSTRPRCVHFQQAAPYAFYEHYHDAFPMPLVDLLLINRHIHAEVRGLLYSIIAFKIDVRKDGTYMCGRRLLEPRRPDGCPHVPVDETEDGKDMFLKTFDWAAVKNYNVDILVESWITPQMPHGWMRPADSSWDEEVEIYDIRDYVSVVVSGILGKARNLCKLQVRLCLADFEWTFDQVLTNTKLIVGPFERLRNVRQPRFAGVFFGKPDSHMVHIRRTRCSRRTQCSPSNRPHCSPSIYSVPPLPTQKTVLVAGMPLFDAYTADWEHRISSNASSSVVKNSPIRAMFTAFKDFYSKLALIHADVTRKSGRNSFLHRARVAREQEDVDAFRLLRNELIQYWHAYVEQEERKKNDMNMRLNRMLGADIYPSHEWDDTRSRRSSAATTQTSTAHSPVLMSVETMTKEGIPMTGNQHVAHPLDENTRLYLVAQAQAKANARAQAKAAQYNPPECSVTDPYNASYMSVFDSRSPPLPAVSGKAGLDRGARNGDPGPSTERKRAFGSGSGSGSSSSVDGGNRSSGSGSGSGSTSTSVFTSTPSSTSGSGSDGVSGGAVETEKAYIGKGKGRMSVNNVDVRYS